jgi:hypothetical protein
MGATAANISPHGTEEWGTCSRGWLSAPQASARCAPSARTLPTRTGRITRSGRAVANEGWKTATTTDSTAARDINTRIGCGA